MTPSQLARQKREVASIDKWAQRLLGVTPVGARERVDRFRRFVTSRGIVRLSRGGDPCWLFSRRRKCEPDPESANRSCSFQPDWLDLHSEDWLAHRRLCTTALGERIFTSQPYELLEADRERLLEFVQRRGLRVSFSDEDSWWFPGKTTLVVLTADSERAVSVARSRAERKKAPLEALIRAYHIAKDEMTTSLGRGALQHVRDLVVHRGQGGDAFGPRRPNEPAPEIQALLAPAVEAMEKAVLGMNHRFPKQSLVAQEWLRDIRAEARGCPSPLEVGARSPESKP